MQVSNFSVIFICLLLIVFGFIILLCLLSFFVEPFCFNERRECWWWQLFLCYTYSNGVCGARTSGWNAMLSHHHNHKITFWIRQTWHVWWGNISFTNKWKFNQRSFTHGIGMNNFGGWNSIFSDFFFLLWFYIHCCCFSFSCLFLQITRVDDCRMALHGWCSGRDTCNARRAWYQVRGPTW